MTLSILSTGSAFGYYEVDSFTPSHANTMYGTFNVINILSYNGLTGPYVGLARLVGSIVAICFAPNSHRRFFSQQIIRSVIEISRLRPMLIPIDLIITINRYHFRFLPIS